jgi:hypothetical protein
MAERRFEIRTEGTSQTTMIVLDGTPIARFYAGRFDKSLLDQIVAALNSGPALLRALKGLLSEITDENTSEADLLRVGFSGTYAKAITLARAAVRDGEQRT